MAFALRYLLQNGLDRDKALLAIKNEAKSAPSFKRQMFQNAISILESGNYPSKYLYEQTFFTNRAPGDESHLLKWYEPVSEEQKQWIADEINKSIDDPKMKYVVTENGFRLNNPYSMEYKVKTGKDAYQFATIKAAVIADSNNASEYPRLASELLARAGIDGVKYPVDSYGKPIKDGDKAGWNYVSFRDDNIRVDHKWRDGQIRFARAIVGGKEIGVATGHRLTVAESKDEAKVREVLGEVVGKEFEQLGETKLVKVSPAFVNEFWRSTYSKKLRSRYDKLWRVKVSSVPILKDILGTTALGPKEAAKHLNKQFKNDVQFYRCNTKFGVLRHDGVAVYPCELLVMEFKDSGARLIYDIVKIQKPTLTANGDLDDETLRRLTEGGTRTGESATDGDSISYSGVKSQAENEKTFRLSRPVERRKDLIAIHNMDAEGLTGADKLGGFAMPSFAVTKDTIGNAEFGDISLLARPETIDPKRRGNKIYSNDAWTPTFPEMKVKLNKEVADRISQRVTKVLRDAKNAD